MKYNKEEMKKKASLCLNCKTRPCMTGCPLQNDIPSFIKYIKEEKYEEAYKILNLTTIFEPICGRICPKKTQCESKCVRSIKGESVKIGELEKFIGDYAIENNIIKNNIIKTTNKKIAIIGGGPSGIACGYYLSQNGAKVTIYEKHEKIGGILRYGIPQFRLDKEILDNWLEKCIINNNIEIKANYELGRNIFIEELEEKYDAIILAFGANISNKMNIEGEEKEYVLGGNELLENSDKMPNFKDKKVAIIGGGNVAIDCARTISKKGAKEVIIIYRRSEEEMPAEPEELRKSKKRKN